MGKYKLLPEHQTQLPAHVEKWTKIILATKRLSAEDKDLCVSAVNRMYDIAEIERPKNIVFVSSPILLAFAGGLSRFIWHKRRNIDATYDATIDATRNATYDATVNATVNAIYDATYNATVNATVNATENATDNATRNATRNATHDATRNATDNATYNATRNATVNATRNATYDATYNATVNATVNATYNATVNATVNAIYDATRNATVNATRNATYDATYNATYNATENATGNATYNATIDTTINSTENAIEIPVGVVCSEDYMKAVFNILKTFDIDDVEQCKEYIRGARHVWQGGCNWAQYDSFLSFFQDVVGLKLDYSKYQPYKDLTVAGYRILDKDFAMISEKPISIKIKNNLAHNFDGPAIEYMDGVKFYMLYGNFVPSYIITTPKNQITKEIILKESNADYRRYLIERIGIDKYVELTGAKVIDTYDSEVGGRYELLEIELSGQKTKYLKMQNRSEFVYHVEGVLEHHKIFKEAHMYRNNMKKFKEPKFLS